MSALLTISIIGLWAGAVYEPTAIIFLSRAAGMDLPSAAKWCLTALGCSLSEQFWAASPPHGWPNGSAAAQRSPSTSSSE
jgi:hypothetical protein